MDARVFCPKCDRQLRVPEERLGRSVVCPECEERFTAKDRDRRGQDGDGPPSRSRRLAREYDDRNQISRPKRRRSEKERPALLLVLVGLPWGMPIITLGSTLWIGFATALSGLCFTIARGPQMRAKTRLFSLLALNGIGYLFFITIILVAIFNRAKRGQQQADEAPGPQRVIKRVPGRGPDRPRAVLPGSTLAGWGQTFDPAGDCTFTPQGTALTIRVPQTAHDLAVEHGRLTAPRVLQEIQGDFIVQVKVGGAVRPTGSGTVPRGVAYQAGGLLLWSDDRNYIRLERAAMVAPGGDLRPLAAFEVRAHGKVGGAQTSPLPDQDTYLRLERRGNEVSASVSTDNRNWTPLKPLTVRFPARVHVGVTAINTAAQLLDARFEEFQVSR